LIQKQIGDQLAQMLLEGKIPDSSIVTASATDGNLKLIIQ
jgi:ATP-dependent Clp protease ATP-binding subunit ClpA